MPDFAGAKPSDRRRRVALGTLMPTVPYHFDGLTVLLSEKVKDKQIHGLSDLDGLNLTIEAGTLGDVILMTFDRGRFIPRIAHVVPGRDQLFPKLESGEADATIVPVHRFDGYRLTHPDARIAPSNFYLPVGFNMGFVALASEARLIDRVNTALGEMLKSGEPASFAGAAYMTYLPPRKPDVLDGITINDLAKLQ
jgi:ABC-type amino acid transport substrate-binding protein